MDGGTAQADRRAPGRDAEEEYLRLEAAPDSDFGAVAQRAALATGSPVALVHLRDRGGAWFTGRLGEHLVQTPSGETMCRRVVEGRAPLVVPDVASDPEASALPAVTGPPHLRSYAGFPVVGRDGHVHGTVCVFDTRPRDFDPGALAVLAGAAAEVEAQLELRLRADEHAQQLAARGFAESALASSEARARAVVTTATDPFVALDAAGTVVDWNPSAERVFGWRAAEALGHRLGDLIVPERLREAHQSALDRVAAGAPSTLAGQRLELPARRRDGREIRVELTIWVTDDPGRGPLFNAFVRDVEDLAQAREAAARAVADAERARGFLAAVVDATATGLVACDATGTVTVFNRTLRDWHGMGHDLDPEEAERRSVRDLRAADGSELPPGAAPLAEALAGHEMSGEHLLLQAEGRPPRHLRVSTRQIAGEGGHPLGAAAVAHDVTDEVAREQALAEARDEALAATRAKSAFLAAVSHEIRTPLNGLLGMLELLGSTRLDEVQAERLGVARTSADVLLALLDDVLDLSAGEAQRVALEERPLDLAAVVRDVGGSFAGAAARGGTRLEVTAPATLPVLGDPHRLRQVLANLVNNAVKFTPAGRVEVTLHEGDTSGAEALDVLLEVADDGAGIAAEEAGRIFQPFEQGHRGRDVGGTGLGLALVRQLVDLMGGEVSLDSRPGAGSTFRVALRLPRGPAADPVEVSAEEGPAARRPLPRLRVLVVDDVAVNRMVASALLEGLDQDVEVAEDGEDALRACAEGELDVVLLDRHMPGTSGLEVARLLRERAVPGARRPWLVALTASTSAADRAECRDAGMDEFLAKPVRGADLEALLRRCAEPPPA